MCVCVCGGLCKDGGGVGRSCQLGVVWINRYVAKMHLILMRCLSGGAVYTAVYKTLPLNPICQNPSSHRTAGRGPDFTGECLVQVDTGKAICPWLKKQTRTIMFLTMLGFNL